MPNPDQDVSIERAEITRSVSDARKLFEVARWVHARRIVGGVDSAIFAHRALTQLLRVLVRVSGKSVPDDFAELVARAREVAQAESLLEEGAGDEIAIIDEMRARAVDPQAETTPADERRYDRAFLKSMAWLGAVQAYVDQRIPKPKTGIVSSLIVVSVILLAFAIGVIVGRHTGGTQPVAIAANVAPSPAPAPPSASAAVPTGPAFEATFYRGVAFGDLILSRRDSAIAFDWGNESPGQGLPLDNFSVRWDGHVNVAEPGKYTFFLTSDDGSRLFVDDNLAVDNWGNHSELTLAGTVQLEAGVHAVRVEYFDRLGGAVIRLEWSSEHLERRLIGAADLR
jgi:hypothetical protein